MSPVLLDHRNLKWIWLSVGLLSFLIFFIGYILGFEQTNNKWMAKLDPVEMAIPNADDLALVVVEAQTPEAAEPGANIDVDSVGANEFDPFSIVNNAEAHTIIVDASDLETVAEINVSEVDADESDETILKTTDLKTITETKTALLSVSSDLDDLVSTQQEVSSPLEPRLEPIVEKKPEATTIVDDASEKTASFSIQVGVYSDFDNAATKAAQLLNWGLNAYLDEHKNTNDETRYKVRFGYFSSYNSGQRALGVYEKHFSGSGYVASIKR